MRLRDRGRHNARPKAAALRADQREALCEALMSRATHRGGVRVDQAYLLSLQSISTCLGLYAYHYRFYSDIRSLRRSMREDLYLMVDDRMRSRL